MLAEYTPMHSRGVISLPPEPESSCLDGLDPRDWDVPVRPLPVACAGFVGIVQESIWAVGKGDPRQIDSPLYRRNPNVSGSDGNGIQERAGLLDDQEIRKSPKHSCATRREAVTGPFREQGERNGRFAVPGEGVWWAAFFAWAPALGK
ncbi:hypothetical protein PENSUB_8386 [Penicillium subrubescens]|uniref:Uncharacterized protein n=1 Tax=Penicillium subrubescens TaxID=1316194 RepID=A0A1Q5TH58_9EURO|nr:hypothetical protein PENSUB_8386 [Penicillium subrubescens]